MGADLVSLVPVPLIDRAAAAPVCFLGLVPDLARGPGLVSGVKVVGVDKVVVVLPFGKDVVDEGGLDAIDGPTV